jgi:hypothetical protein
VRLVAVEVTVPEQQPEHDPRRRFCNTFNKCAQFRDLEAENARLREDAADWRHAAEVNGQACQDRARERDEARAQVIRELREAASDEGPRSAYWLAADYLERK